MNVFIRAQVETPTVVPVIVPVTPPERDPFPPPPEAPPGRDPGETIRAPRELPADRPTVPVRQLEGEPPDVAEDFKQ